MKQPQYPTALLFHQTEQTLTLGGEPVLVYRINCPSFQWDGWNTRHLTQYYTRFFSHIETRWQKKSYIDACFHLVHQRECSREPTPFQCTITGEGAFVSDHLLSLCFDMTEQYGDSTPIHVRHCDLWDLTTMTPIPLKQLMNGRFWRKNLIARVTDALHHGEEAGLFLLKDDWKTILHHQTFHKHFHLTGDGLTLFFPQYTLAHTADILSIPLGFDSSLSPLLCPVPPEV